MKNLHEAIRTNNFRHLTEDAIQAPLSFIKNFCHFETEVEIFREDILFFFNAATTRKSDFNGRFYINAEDYAYNHRQMITVIEALWVLYHQPIPALSIPDTHPLYQKSSWVRDGIDVEKRINSGAANFRKLENREINDIRIFLEEFFLYRDLNEWRKILDDLLTYAHTDESIFEGTTLLYESVAIREYLEKTVEAIFLIASLSFEHNESVNHTQTKSNQEAKSNTTEHIDESLYDQINEAPPLEDDNFTDSLIQYLEKYWNHLDGKSGNYSYGPVMFTEKFERELLSYFESFHPKFLGRNFRRVYMGYLEHLFTTGTPYYYDELSAFTAHMDTFFELLELADEETAHWKQQSRIGNEED